MCDRGCFEMPKINLTYHTNEIILITPYISIIPCINYKYVVIFFRIPITTNTLSRSAIGLLKATNIFVCMSVFSLFGIKTCNVDRYNVLTGEWVVLDVVQEEHCYSDHSAVASDDGTIYIFGGYSSDYLAMDTVVKVEVSGDNLTFSTTTPMGLVSCTVIVGAFTTEFKE